jgi:hypothetical protein
MSSSLANARLTSVTLDPAVQPWSPTIVPGFTLKPLTPLSTTGNSLQSQRTIAVHDHASQPMTPAHDKIERVN